MCYYPLTHYLCRASPSTHYEPPSPCRTTSLIKPFPYPIRLCPSYSGPRSIVVGKRFPICPNAKWETHPRKILTIPIKCPTCTNWFTTRMGVSTMEHDQICRDIIGYFPTLRRDYVEQRRDEIMCLVYERIAKEVTAKTKEVEQEWDRAMLRIVQEVLRGGDFDLVRSWANVRGLDYDALRRERAMVLREEVRRNQGFSATARPRSGSGSGASKIKEMGRNRRRDRQRERSVVVVAPQDEQIYGVGFNDGRIRGEGEQCGEGQIDDPNNTGKEKRKGKGKVMVGWESESEGYLSD
ncbi:hypothetical protein QBC35DRAFT_496428 [Podospora australis]|uniref:Uncharacterized protein n=1 Tax=Podospora australis TaxID=1536484 RepID=A0AAN7AJN1_9PEZI|nr:hypothetical protein QBC35DRAFT_496428 [Podospora australis]